MAAPRRFLRAAGGLEKRYAGIVQHGEKMRVLVLTVNNLDYNKIIQVIDPGDTSFGFCAPQGAFDATNREPAQTDSSAVI